MSSNRTFAGVIQLCGVLDLEAWSGLRTELWPDGSIEEHCLFALQSLDDPLRFASFIARGADGTPLGLAEASIRSDYFNGCSTSPVGFLEGLFVRDEARRHGIARGLIVAVEQWARERGCSELAFDALLDNETSHQAHRGVGFAETERVIFCKSLEAPVAQ
jgi:aminoglycoside 6'-N-acetyltransferase I